MNWLTRVLKKDLGEDNTAAFKADPIEQRDIADLENMLFDACRMIVQTRSQLDGLEDRVKQQETQIKNQSIAISNLTIDLKTMHNALPKITGSGCNCDCNKTY